MHRRILLLSALALIILTGCAPTASQPAAMPQPTGVATVLLPTPTHTPTPMPEPTTTPPPAEEESQADLRSSAMPEEASDATAQPRLMRTPLPKGERVQIDGQWYESDGALLQPLPTAGAPATSELERVSEAARALAAEQLGLEGAKLLVRQVKAVTWPDTSLGCPQEGYLYAQVLTPGYKVLLEGPAATYEVHLDAQGNGTLCPPPE